MKKVILFVMNFALVASALAQKQVFDVLNYTPPKDWDKTETPQGIQLSTKNDGQGNYATAVILRSTATTAASQENFNNSWDKLVKGTVSVSGEPTTQPAVEKGWDIVSGQARYTDGANKGWVTLITATGNGKMANVVILTNTDNYQTQILDFINSLDLNETATAQKPVSSTNTVTGPGIKNTYSITVPPTWSLNAGGNNLAVEKNTNTGKRIIEFMSMIQSSGSLEKDMEHIFFEVFDGWSLHNSPNNLLFEQGDHEKGLTSQGLPYYMLSNSISKNGSDVIKGTVLLIQAGTNVAIVNSADNILGSETEMALNFLLFTLKINGVAGKNVDYKKQLTGTWGSNSGLYGNSLSTVTSYLAEGKYYVLTQSSYTVGYDYYNDLIKNRKFKSHGLFSVKGNILERKYGSGAATNYFIRFYARKYGKNDWENVMSLYDCNYDKNKIEAVIRFHKI
ncbi:MAG: hypothetical protein J0G98_09545 [Terrimonas ferruginea]|uniref:hypothetical protein n=1 Tax=Terrimonas ferruginea TaxID=249 RepID=UPI000925F8CE|nr:hypothetical protein [Terrimonas ferruginea]MBN8783299.1 hypothetical protein [Terrimonas ferruginea]OJW39914.1 MAG: hypothetical protein BGO56_03360 [Sphingobacteriales bacterium 48-107]